MTRNYDEIEESANEIRAAVSVGKAIEKAYCDQLSTTDNDTGEFISAYYGLMSLLEIKSEKLDASIAKAIQEASGVFKENEGSETWNSQQN